MKQTIRNFLTVPVGMLLIAMTTLLYAGYRADRNQQNQTTRAAGFEMLKTLNALQMVIDSHRYTLEKAPDYITGWSHVLLVDDLAPYINADVVRQADSLHTVWKKNFEQLSTQKANQDLTEAISQTRFSLNSAIQTLH